MPINSRAFVEPAIAEAGVHAHHQKILSAIVEKVGYVEVKGSVSIVIATNEVAVQKYERAAEGAIELHDDAASLIFLRNIEGAPVPSHAGLGVAASQWLVAVTLQFVVT